MLQIFRTILLFVILIIVNHVLFITTASAAVTLRVATFNTQRGSPGWDCDVTQNPRREEKIVPLADYIIKTKVDVIMLQEMIRFYKCDDYDETKRLSEVLAEKGYPMYYAVVPQSMQKNGMHVPIFSKYPIYTDEIEYIPDDDDWRIYIRVPIQTPLGKIYFYNAHIHHRDPCDGLPIYIGKIRTDAKQLSVTGGDFNIGIRKDNACKLDIRKNFYVEPGDGIDYLLLPLAGPLHFDQVWSDGSAPPSDHAPIFATLSSTLPPAKVGDLNSDGRVDIFDYNALLQQFGKTGAPGFTPADININGAVDIFDYNTLLVQFGK